MAEYMQSDADNTDGFSICSDDFEVKYLDESLLEDYLNENFSEGVANSNEICDKRVADDINNWSMVLEENADKNVMEVESCDNNGTKEKKTRDIWK